MSTAWLKNFLKQNYLFIVLTILAFTIHFAFLSYPSQAVFDEIYFGKFASSYLNHQYYFDIHPPLGKLIIAGWTNLVNFTPNFDFDHIGAASTPQLFFIMRFLPALFGSLFVLIFSWLAYLATRSKQIALIAGILILLDNAFLVQSRLILVDIFLLFFVFLTLCFFLLYQRQKSFSPKWFAYLALAGVSFGLAISIKWTGLASILVIATILFFKIFNERLANWLSPDNYQIAEAPRGHTKEIFIKDAQKKFAKIRMKEGLIGLIAIPLLGFLVYLIPFYIHFNLLDKSGQGDAFMSQKFQQELKLGKDNVADPLSFWQKFTELNTVMFTANWGVTSEHPYGSRWYSWPFDKKPIYYWLQSSENSNGKVGKIYFLGNPVIWWLALGAVLYTIIRAISGKERKRITPFIYILILAYLANILPFIGIKRVSFLYHYMLSASFAIMILSVYLGEAWQKNKGIIAAAIAVIAVVFIILTPISYGWLMTPSMDKFEMRIIDLLS